MHNGFFKSLEKVKKSKFTIPSKSEPMEAIMENLSKHFDKNDCEYLNELSRCQRLIVLYTKKKEYDESLEIINLSKKIIEQLRNDARMMGQIFVYPSFAYYASKRKNNRWAKRYINLTIKYDDCLSDKFPILHLHKIHHILNLNQIFISSNDNDKCANLFLDIYQYLSTYNLDPKYGMGGEKYFQKISSKFNISTTSGDFIEEYFMCLWQNPNIETVIHSNPRKKIILKKGLLKNKNLMALKDYFIIQELFMQKTPEYNLILNYFKKYDFYLYDPYKLLILRNLYQQTKEIANKEIILKVVSTKMNFKAPNLLIEQFRNFD